MMDAHGNRSFVSLNISPSYHDDSEADSYILRKNNKESFVITTNWRRKWKQLSRFQRSVIYMGVLLGVIVVIVLAPSIKRQKVSLLKSQPLSHKMDSWQMKEKAPPQLPLVQIEDPDLSVNRVVPKVIPKIEKQQIQQPNQEIGKSVAVEDKTASNVQNEPLVFKGPQNERQEEVVKAFKHAWKAYKEFAWGHDHLKPITKTFHDWFGVGLTIIDALDTMYIMNLDEEFQEAKTFVADQLDFNINKDVNLFETTIRVLGGLLSAYHLSKDEIFLKKAVDLGDLLMHAFSSSSGIPYSDINLYTHHSHAPRWGPDSSVSEVATIQLEFKDLSRLTGDPKYEKAADRVTELIHKLPKTDGLVPMYINADTGKFRPYATITLGARADSYYEYLIKQWLHTGKTRDFLIRDYNESVSGILKHLVKLSEPNKLTFVGELTSGKNFRPKMDHLVCYLPSVLALGVHNGLPKEHFRFAEKLLYTCYQMYARMPTFLSAEIAHFNLIPSAEPDIFVKVNDAHNLLRPETLESIYYFYHLTRNRTYQDWGWEIFQAFEKYTKVKDGGYTSIDNVKNHHDTRPRDMMESFFLAETLKYLYLLFDEEQSLSLDKYVFNSEGHPLPIYNS